MIKKLHNSIKRQMCLTLLFFSLGYANLNAQCNVNANFTFGYFPYGSVVFNNISTGAPLNAICKYNFGDGNNSGNGTLQGTVYTPHTYVNNGTYHVTFFILDITSTNNCYDTMSVDVTVTNAGNYASTLCPQNVNFNYSFLNNGLVNFNSTAILGTGATNANYVWRYGDGTPDDTTLIGSHTYLYNGKYKVYHQVSTFDSIAAYGCLVASQKNISITNGQNSPCTNMNASFNYSIGAGGLVTFNNISTGIPSNPNYQWVFGDLIGYSNLANPQYIYTKNDSFKVTLVMQDSIIGCYDDTSIYISISNVIPICTASAYFEIEKDTTTSLKWRIIPTYSSSLLSAKWFWGDGTSTAGFYPSHTYASAGVYNVCLEVTDSCGAKDTLCNYNYVYKSANQLGAVISIDVVSNIIGGLNFVRAASIENLRVYPNPNNGSFKLESNTKGDFKIMNSLGREINSIYLDGMNDKDISLELSNGIYYIVGGSGISRKIVISQ
jgi:PKD repeat protein